MVVRISPGSRMSQVVMHRDFIYVSGQVADLPNKGITDQTQSVLSKIDRLLTEVGATKSDLVNVTVLLPQITDFDDMNAVYDAWIDPANPPARACYEARLADPELRIEITAVAAAPGA